MSQVTVARHAHPYSYQFNICAARSMYILCTNMHSCKKYSKLIWLNGDRDKETERGSAELKRNGTKQRENECFF